LRRSLDRGKSMELLSLDKKFKEIQRRRVGGRRHAVITDASREVWGKAPNCGWNHLDRGGRHDSHRSPGSATSTAEFVVERKSVLSFDIGWLADP